MISSEDQRFFEHWGFDTAEIERAVGDHLRGEPLRGASTLAQQVAKNLFLWEGRGFTRKALEAYFTFWIELMWSKHRILRPGERVDTRRQRRRERALQHAGKIEAFPWIRRRRTLYIVPHQPSS